MQELLPVKFYHVVFTLPHELNSLVSGHRKILYNLLFDASAQTLLSFAKDEKYMGAVPGIISVLHTWGQQLSLHPHIPSIVSGGGIMDDNNWKDAKKNIYRFLFPLKAMSVVYKTKFLQALKELIVNKTVVQIADTDISALFNTLYKKEWVVYAKAPFGGPQSVIEYLGRYTHKVAISNHRVSSITGAYGLRMVAAEHLKIYGQRIHGQAAAHMFPTHRHRDVFMQCLLNIMCIMKFVSTMFPILKSMHCSWRKKAVRVLNVSRWNWRIAKTWCLPTCTCFVL